MINQFWYYGGAGKPLSSMDVHSVFQVSPAPRIIAMSQEEQDYLAGLQLVYGREMSVYTFEEFHDRGWENQKKNPLDQYLHHLCCSVNNLTELMLLPHGVEKWKRELARRERTRPRYDYYLNDPKGLFI